jgi:hypothetical protein
LNSLYAATLPHKINRMTQEENDSHQNNPTAANADADWWKGCWKPRPPTRIIRSSPSSSYCRHFKPSYTCLICYPPHPPPPPTTGVKVCIHKRRLRECKDCGGSGICMHNKRRTRCRDCGGGSLCHHSRERSKCKVNCFMAKKRCVELPRRRRIRRGWCDRGS